MYLPLDLEVYHRLFIDSLGFMAVDRIKKHLLGFTESKLTAAVSIFDLVLPLQVLLIII